MLYRLGDLVLLSNIELPELLTASQPAPEVRFQVGNELSSKPAEANWFHHRPLPDGTPFISFAREKGGYRLRFAGMADFLVSSDSTSVDCYPVAGLPMTTLRHLLLDQVLPMVLSQRGRMVLHASAVVLPEGAVGFLGETGRGKSTMAACFTSRGHALISDDFLIVQGGSEGLTVLPSYPGIRLRPEVIPRLYGTELELPRVAHYTHKQRLSPANSGLTFARSPVPLRRLYALPTPEESCGVTDILSERLPFRESFIQLVQSSFQLDCRHPRHLRNGFQMHARMAPLPFLYRLLYPRDLDRLSSVYDAIRADVRRDAPLREGNGVTSPSLAVGEKP